MAVRKGREGCSVAVGTTVLKCFTLRLIFMEKAENMVYIN